MWKEIKDYKPINKQNNYRCNTHHEGNKEDEVESEFTDW